MELSGKPWNVEQEQFPREIYVPRGMIGPEERRCYYWLARHWLSGKGCIVDAGSFLGASTFCFAAGAASVGHRKFRDAALVHAYDYFSAIDEYVSKFIRTNVRPIEKGDSYLDIFEAQVAPYLDAVKAYPGNFLDRKWGGSPIEILFIDIAKNAKLNSHAVGEFFPHLIPNRSVLVHQDYFHCWHPYIHIAMQFFDEEFDVVDEHVLFQSRVWRLVKPLSQEKIARVRAWDFDKAERLAYLDRLVERSSAYSRPMIEIVRLWQRQIDKDYDDVERDMARLRREYGVDGRPELWFRQAISIEEFARAQKGGAAGKRPPAPKDLADGPSPELKGAGPKPQTRKQEATGASSPQMESFLSIVPQLHTWDEGKTWSNGGFGSVALRDLLRGLTSFCSAETPIIAETGAGSTTVLFLLMKPSRLYSIAPDEELKNRIIRYCRDNEIDLEPLDFRVARSEPVLPGIAADLKLQGKKLDIALMDGGHGWPTVFVDFCYMNAALKKGGLLIVDDLQIYSVNEFARWLSMQKEYLLVCDLKKTLVFRKETTLEYLNDFGAQPYIQKQTKLRAVSSDPYEVS